MGVLRGTHPPKLPIDHQVPTKQFRPWRQYEGGGQPSGYGSGSPGRFHDHHRFLTGLALLRGSGRGGVRGVCGGRAWPGWVEFESAACVGPSPGRPLKRFYF